MDFIENVVLPIIFMIFAVSILAFVAYKFDTKTTEKIDALVNKNDLEVYDNCWKLEGKFYCKNIEGE